MGQDCEEMVSPTPSKTFKWSSKITEYLFSFFSKKNEKKNDNIIVMSENNAMLEKMNSIKRKQISLSILGISSTYLF